MKKILILLLTTLVFGLTKISAQTCSSEKGNNDFPFTSNGITVEKVLTGTFATYKSEFPSCGIIIKANSIWSGQSGATIFQNSFSIALNDVMYNLAGSNNTEAFTVTVSNGTPSISTVVSDCSSAWSISGNVLTCVNDAGLSYGAGGRFKIHSTEPYSWIKFAHNGGGGGTIFTLCFDAAFESVQPVLETKPVESVTSTSASGGGNVTAEGGTSVFARGVCWNTTGSPTVNDCHSTDGNGAGIFESSISSLTEGTTYYVRAYATNSNRTAYGSQLSFKTFSSPAPSDPASISASSNPICNGAGTQLTALGAEGTVNWYTSGCGGTLVTTGNPIVVKPSASTTYYARNYNNAKYSNGCASITVTVNRLPDSPVPGVNSNIYAGTTFTALAGVGNNETVDWYADLTVGNTIAAPSGINVYSYSAYAEARNTVTGCVSASRTLISMEIMDKDLTIAVVDEQRCADGKTFDGYTVRYDGFVNNETPDVLEGRLVFNSKAIKSVVTEKYTITPSGLSSPNYAITYLDGTLIVYPIPAEPVIIQKGDTLTSSAISGNQWYKDGNIIEGATGNKYIAEDKGSYAVVVTAESCSSAPSNSILVLPVSTKDFEVSTSFDVYPNPSKGKFNIKVSSAKPVEVSIEVYSNTGVLLLKQEAVSIDGTYIAPVVLEDYPNGIYIVILRTKKITVEHRIVVMK